MTLTCIVLPSLIPRLFLTGKEPGYETRWNYSRVMAVHTQKEKMSQRTRLSSTTLRFYLEPDFFPIAVRKKPGSGLGTRLHTCLGLAIDDRQCT